MTEPACFNGFHASGLFCACQGFVVIACRVTHFLLQGVVSIQRFFLLHFRRDVIANVSQRLGFGRLDIIQTRHQEANGRFDHTRELTFLFQACVFQLIRGGGIFQPAHITAVFRRDDIGGFFFRQCGKISAFG
ncbi:hypothetical protein D3C71_1681260 [compost metagenome]